MSSSTPPPGVDPIALAAEELRLTRLAQAAMPKRQQKAGKKAGKDNESKTVRCQLRITQDENQKLVRLKKQLARHGADTNRKQLVRAGLLLLSHLEGTDLKTAIRDVIAPEPTSREGE
ncbi:MAG: hypothetical protein V5B33_03550 [Candidatus Accumulibacter sp. UW20]|jgi:hypothetical protein